MKTLVIEVTSPVAGDLVVVEAAAKRGGRIGAAHKVLGDRVVPIVDIDGYLKDSKQLPADTGHDISKSLAEQINKGWLPECVSAKVKDGTGVLVINCTDLFDDTTFIAQVQGDGGTIITMVEY